MMSSFSRKTKMDSIVVTSITPTFLPKENNKTIRNTSESDLEETFLFDQKPVTVILYFWK